MSPDLPTSLHSAHNAGDPVPSTSPAPTVSQPQSPHASAASLPSSIFGFDVLRVPQPLRLLAAQRIVGSTGADTHISREVAARRFIESAEKMGIDVSLMWGTLDPSGRYFHQVCLVIIGAGRTAMLFLSEDDPDPPSSWHPGDPLAQTTPRSLPAAGIQQRALLIQHACRHLQTLRGPIPSRAAAKSGRILSPRDPSIIMVQALLDIEELDAADALARVGFIRLGDLVYMRRPLPGSSSRRTPRPDPISWPPGITVQPLSSIDPALHHDLLARALARSYIDTLDCPELCGLRTIDDVIDSHRAVGELDLSTWWIVFLNDQPEGALLLSPCLDQAPPIIELVYLGLSPVLRGKGLGAALLKMGLAAVAGTSGASSIACAVDARNSPAMKLYKRAGFQRFSVRVPLVMGLAT